MADLYFDYLPRELITLLVSKLDVNSLESFYEIEEDINWRDVYRLRYPYFIGFYSKIKKHDVKPFDYESYHDILILEKVSDIIGLRPLYDCIKYNYVEYAPTYLPNEPVIYGTRLHLTYEGVGDTLYYLGISTFNHFWDVVQLLCEIYVIKVYPIMYDKFTKHYLDVYDYSIMNDTLYKIVWLNDVSAIKTYIRTGKWDDSTITLNGFRDFEVSYHDAMGNPKEKEYYIILLIMVCAFLEDNARVDPEDNFAVVDYVEVSIGSFEPNAEEHIEKLLAPIYHPDESVSERGNTIGDYI